MLLRCIRCSLAGVAVICSLKLAACADELCLDISRPACGKVCKLVCDTKKLTSIGFGAECKSICLPEPSRAGCKHCAVCYGQGDGNPCDGCPNCPPKCEFCWRDWFACGCAQPRTVRVLTKYQAEKKICWYHWEVVDASSCDCASPSDPDGKADKHATNHAGRAIYKAAPTDAELGAVIPVTDEEWVKLAAVLSPDSAASVAGTEPQPTGKTAAETSPPNPSASAPSLAERIQRMLKK